jgi:hypothetical protein
MKMSGDREQYTLWGYQLIFSVASACYYISPMLFWLATRISTTKQSATARPVAIAWPDLFRPVAIAWPVMNVPSLASGGFYRPGQSKVQTKIGKAGEAAWRSAKRLSDWPESRLL